MRHSIGIAVIALVAVSATLAWTLTQSGANTQNKLSGTTTLGINTLAVTMQASAMPVQIFDAI
jgi:hypothetical protein